MAEPRHSQQTNKSLSRRTNAVRFLLPPLLAIVLAVATVQLLALPALENNMMNDKRSMIRDLVCTISHMLTGLDQDVQDGTKTLAQAQKEAISCIRSMRYGPEGKDYFWINDMQPKMVMHPYRTDLEGNDVSDFTDPNGKHLFLAFVEAVKNNGDGYVDYQWQWKDDENRIVPKLSYVHGFESWGWIIGTGVYLEDVREEIAAVTHKHLYAFSGILLLMVALSVYMISQSTRAESRLRNSHERFRTVMDSLDAMVYVADLKTYELLFVNKAILDSRGDVVGQTCWRSLRPDQPGPCPDCSNNTLLNSDGEPTGIVVWETQNNVDKRWYECRDQAFRWTDGRLVRMGIVTDITSRKLAKEETQRLDDQFRQAQKLEAIGKLAGGIAHDFNNLLTGIIGNAQLIELEVPDDSSIAVSAGEIIKTSKRATDLTRQLLAFSRKGQLRSEPVDLHGVIDDVVQMLKHTIDRRIEILTDLKAEPSQTKGDSNQLHNALLNLGNNARDAMPAGGTLTIATSNRTLSTDYCGANCPEIVPGNYIQISFTDTGRGMAPDIRDRIFEPFFTTKETGKGTGLGLASVYGCIRGHHGSLEVHSVLDQGTTFNILLPATGAKQRGTLTGDREQPIRGRGNILVVDDEETVRTFTVKALRTLGYTPFECNDGIEAVDFFRRRAADIDLVILDLIMPRMNGHEAFAELKRIRPDVHILIASGFAQDTSVTALLDRGACGFLSKPFGISELSKNIAKFIPQTAELRYSKITK